MRKTVLCFVVVILSWCLALGQANFKVLWNFGENFKDGIYPTGTLIFDSAGNLYGTASEGGNSQGSVFELSPNQDGTWSETVLYTFCPPGSGCADGADPETGLVQDSAGNLYGSTYFGGNQCPSGNVTCGVIFELSPPLVPGGDWTYANLHTFCANTCTDGGHPSGQLILDSSWNLYGTTGFFGSEHGHGGTVFELSRSNGWAITVLHTFCSLGHDNVCPDGASPAAGLTFDNSGNLYGTTIVGGSTNSIGTGTVYELSPTQNGWTETVLATGNGGYPGSAVRFDSQGNIYGTATGGWKELPGRNGGVFKLDAKNGYKKAAFKFDLTDGSVPWAEVLIDSERRVLYGTTSGGNYSFGNVFQIDASGHETVLHSFCELQNCADGLVPFAGLIQDSSGNLYGVASRGGTYNGGVVFQITR